MMLLFRIKLLWKDIQISWLKFQEARAQSQIAIIEIKNVEEK